MKSVILAIPLLLSAAATQAADVKSEINAANQKFGAAYAKGDAAAIARLYTPHATVFPPGSDMVTGREGGRFTAEAPNAQKQITKLDGKYVVVWKRSNGTWMLDSDIWNLNQ
ncbi:MAG: hypothetical protein ABSC06_23090 [Rhodopila sp.]